jgi:hypothetical protein
MQLSEGLVLLFAFFGVVGFTVWSINRPNKKSRDGGGADFDFGSGDGDSGGGGDGGGGD